MKCDHVRMTGADPASESKMPNRSRGVRCCVALLRGYKQFISPFFPPSCRYTPTCSQYAIDAVQKHGVMRGLLLAMRRILRCHPFAGSGYDPVK